MPYIIQECHNLANFKAIQSKTTLYNFIITSTVITNSDPQKQIISSRPIKDPHLTGNLAPLSVTDPVLAHDISHIIHSFV